MRLRPQRVCEAANPVELAKHAFELGPVAKRDHGADTLATDHRGHAVRDEDAITREEHLIASDAVSREDVAHATRGDALFDLSSFDGAFEPEQAARFVVYERDAAIAVRRDDPFADAVEHRLALLEQRGDIAWLKAEGLTLQASREEERAGDPETESEGDVAAHHRHPLEKRRIHLILQETHRDDPDDLSLRAEDRHLRSHGFAQRALLDPDPRLPLQRRRRVGRNTLADLLGVRMRVADAIDVCDDHERRRLALADRFSDRLDDGRRLRIGEGLDHVGHRRDRMADGERALLVFLGHLLAHERVRDQRAREHDPGDHGHLEQEDLRRKLAWSPAHMLRPGGAARSGSEMTRTTGRTE